MPRGVFAQDVEFFSQISNNYIVTFRNGIQVKQAAAFGGQQLAKGRGQINRHDFYTQPQIPQFGKLFLGFGVNVVDAMMRSMGYSRFVGFGDQYQLGLGLVDGSYQHSIGVRASGL